MAKKSESRGLGRSFYEIMGDNVLDNKGGAGQNLRISDIEPRRDQPRKTFEREALQALADSIAVYGVLRFFNETLRGDNVLYAKLTPAQWIGMLLFFAGCGLVIFYQRKNNDEQNA